MCPELLDEYSNIDSLACPMPRVTLSQVIESIFYMWRATHDRRWRDMGWQMWRAVQAHCRWEGGYSGALNATQVGGPIRLATAGVQKRGSVWRCCGQLEGMDAFCSNACRLLHCLLNVAGTHQLTLPRPHRLRLLSNCSSAHPAPSQVPVESDDVQQSWFLAETLKYFWLLFSPDSALPLHHWVLNTEAHPLQVLAAHGGQPAAAWRKGGGGWRRGLRGEPLHLHN